MLLSNTPAETDFKTYYVAQTFVIKRDTQARAVSQSH